MRPRSDERDRFNRATAIERKRRANRAHAPLFVVPFLPLNRSTVPPFHRSTVPPFHRSTVPPRSHLVIRNPRCLTPIIRRINLEIREKSRRFTLEQPQNRD